MKKPELNYGWLQWPDLRFSPIVQRVIDGLTDNPDFTDPESMLQELKDQYALYLPFVVSRQKVSTASAALRVKARAPVEKILRLLGPWVQMKSGGDLTKLISTNWPLADVPMPAADPEVPTNVVLTISGDPVVLHAKCRRQSNSKFYAVQVSEDNATWTWSSQNSAASVDISGLPLGQRLYLRMRMENVNGPSDWTPSIPFRIPLPDEVVPLRKKQPKPKKD